MAKMKLRAKAKDDSIQIKALMNHPMETGRRLDKDGQQIPEHFIQLVQITQGDEVLLKIHWGPGISRNPYMSVKVKGPKSGDIITVYWEDNLGNSETGAVTVA